MADNTYTNGGEVEGANLPTYQSPDNQWIYDMILERMSGGTGVQGVVDSVRNIQPTPFLDRLPFGQEQIGQYIGNRLSGKGVAERAQAYTQEQLDAVNRQATNANKQYQASTAATGGRGSSFDAAAQAQGRIALGSARGGARQAGMQYEDALRDRSFQQGMGALQAYQGAANQDWNQALQGGQLALQSLAPELQQYGLDMDTLHNLYQMNFADTMSENEWNMMLNQLVRSGANGNDLLNFLGQAGGTFAGLAATGGI